VAVNYNSNGAGIREAMGSSLNHYGIGDTADYWYINSHGGTKAASDEGTEFADVVSEDTTLITGTCSTGCTTGSTQIKLTVTSGAGTQGVGRILIDTTTGAISNTIVSMAAGLGAAEAVTVGTPITQSNAWGQLTANVRPSWGNLASPPFSTTQTFSMNNIKGTYDTTHPICFSDQFNDNTIPASVTGSGTITITAPIYRPHASGSYVYQGGMCGYWIEVAAKTSRSNRYVATVVGSTSTTTLQVVFFQFGAAKSGPLNGGGKWTNQAFAIGNIGNLSSIGTTVYASGVTSGTFVRQYLHSLNKSTFIISKASYSPFNTACTGATWLSSSEFTCTISDLTAGPHSSTTANFQLGYVVSSKPNPLNVNIA